MVDLYANIRLLAYTKGNVNLYNIVGYTRQIESGVDS